MKREYLVKRAVREILRELGCWYCMPQGTGFAASGIMDFIVCYRGECLGIECKSGKNQTTALQDKTIRELEQAGGRAIVVNEDNIQLLKEWICQQQVPQVRSGVYSPRA